MFASALQHFQAGRVVDAEAVCGETLRRNPCDADCLHLLGVISHQRGDHAGAIGCIDRAVAIKPAESQFHNTRGAILGAMGRREEALVAFLRAVELQPDNAGARQNVGVTLLELGRVNEAITSLQQTVARHPDLAEAHYNLGNALRAAKKFAESIQPFRCALALAPGHVDALGNLGISLVQSGDVDAAIEVLRRAVLLRPQSAMTHWALGWALLLNGDFTSGWPEIEWRMGLKEAAPYHRDFVKPAWDGTDVRRRTILLHAEQGLGDTIQFARFATVLARRGAKIVLECQAELAQLMESVPGVDRVVARGQALGAFDVHCSLLSVPKVLGTELDTIPASAAYLHPDATIAAKWKTRIGDETGLKIGLVWKGSSTHPGDAMRSMNASQLAPILAVAGARFFSLQKNAKPHAGGDVVDWTNDLTNFSETAGLVANLDLIIAVDTSVAHLAGAMGKPVWAMLPFAPDWRWLRDREDCPWYPTMRLFRQRSVGDWEDVVARVSDALRELSAPAATK